jgi:hypothetical protein
LVHYFLNSLGLRQDTAFGESGERERDSGMIPDMRADRVLRGCTLESQRRPTTVRDVRRICQKKEIAKIGKIASLVYCGDNEEKEEPVWTASASGRILTGISDAICVSIRCAG